MQRDQTHSQCASNFLVQIWLHIRRKPKDYIKRKLKVFAFCYDFSQPNSNNDQKRSLRILCDFLPLNLMEDQNETKKLIKSLYRFL